MNLSNTKVVDLENLIKNIFDSIFSQRIGEMIEHEVVKTRLTCAIFQGRVELGNLIKTTSVTLFK